MKTAVSKILVAVDGSQNSMNAARYALVLAKNYAANILIVNVVDLPPIFKILPGKTKKQLLRLGRLESHRMLDVVKNIAAQSGVNVKTEVIEGSTPAADVLINYSKQKGIDLIVIGTKKSGMRKALLGSVASKVVTYAKCPVLVVR